MQEITQETFFNGGMGGQAGEVGSQRKKDPF